MRIKYHVGARLDLLEIVTYYEHEGGTGPADRFVSELRRYIEAMAKRPQSYPEHATGVRRANLRRFPYHVLFRIMDDNQDSCYKT
jgi:plasmid stabilization system protein ParE